MAAIACMMNQYLQFILSRPYSAGPVSLPLIGDVSYETMKGWHSARAGTVPGVLNLRSEAQANSLAPRSSVPHVRLKCELSFMIMLLEGKD